MNRAPAVTLNLKFKADVGAVPDLDAATRICRDIVDRIEVAAPSPGWRFEQTDPPVSKDRLIELVMPNGTNLPDEYCGWGWGLLSGTKPSEVLYLVAHIGGIDVETTAGGGARIRTDPERFGLVEVAYRQLTGLPGIRLVQISAGAGFHLDQGGSLARVGWKNWLACPNGVPADLDLPDWVTIEEHDGAVEVTLGPSPFDVTSAEAAPVRDLLVRSGLLVAPKVVWDEGA